MSREQTREVLSAVLDGEAADLETRRSLRDLDQDDLGTLGRWQLARDVLSRHPVAAVPDGFNRRLADALKEEQQGPAGLTGHLARLAVAASVAMATVLGWQYWGSSEMESANMLASAPVEETREVRETREEVRQVPAGLRALVEPSLVAQGGRDSSRSAQPRQASELNPMLVRHSEFAARHGAQGMTPYVRLVSMDAKQERR